MENENTVPTVVTPLDQLPMHQRMEAWRKGQNPTGKKMTLHSAKERLGLSIGYISDLESGKVPVTMQVYRKYHEADPAAFPVADAGLLI